MELLGPFLHHLKYQRNYADRTIESYERDLKQFFGYLQSRYKVEKVTPHLFESVSVEVIYAWFQQLQVSKRSLARKISALRTFTRYWKKQGVLERDPFSRIHLPKLPKRLVTTLNEEQIQQVIAQLPPATSYSEARDRLILLLLYGCGLRRDELIHLTLEQVHLQRNELRIHGKGNKVRVVPIPSLLKKEIEQYLRFRQQLFSENPTSPLLLTDKGRPLYPMFVQRKVRHYCHAIFPKSHPHLFRHSIATHLRNQGVDIEFIRQLLGHASLSTTQVYLHTSKKELKEAYKRFHPFK